jgi:branched-chain amino acid transport system permease protein
MFKLIINKKIILWIIPFVIFLILPFLRVPTRYHLSVLTITFIYMIFVSSWDLLCGVTDQINFGYALFIGVSGYVVAFTSNIGSSLFHLVLGASTAAIFAMIIGYPCLRLRGSYLALATFVFPLILIRLAFTFSNITGGEYGIVIAPPLNYFQLYFLCLLLAFFTMFVMYALANSKFGMRLKAIGEDEDAALASGINVTFFKIMAYCVSGFFGGMGGVLYTYYMGHVSPHSFDVWISVAIVTMAMVGGIGSIVGAALGAFILSLAGEWLRGIEEFRVLIYSGILIFTMLLLPQGIWGLLRNVNADVFKKGETPKGGWNT